MPQAANLGFFLDPFYTMDRGKAVPIGKHCQAVQNRLLIMMAIIENSTYVFHKGLSAGLTAISPSALGCSAKFYDVPVTCFAVVRTSLVPAERAWKNHFFPLRIPPSRYL
jgi:hypothetical protein